MVSTGGVMETTTLYAHRWFQGIQIDRWWVVLFDVMGEVVIGSRYTTIYNNDECTKAYACLGHTSLCWPSTPRLCDRKRAIHTLDIPTEISRNGILLYLDINNDYEQRSNVTQTQLSGCVCERGVVLCHGGKSNVLYASGLIAGLFLVNVLCLINRMLEQILFLCLIYLRTEY